MIAERLKQIRACKDMNQADFAKMLGIGQSTLAMMEVGKRAITDRHIKTICALCNVREAWLRNGEGEMYAHTDDTLLERLEAELGLLDEEKEILSVWLEFPIDKRKEIIEYGFDFAARLASKKAAPPQPAPTPEEREIARKVAEYEKVKAAKETAPPGEGDTVTVEISREDFLLLEHLHKEKDTHGSSVSRSIA